LPFLLQGLQINCPLHPANRPLYRVLRGDIHNTRNPQNQKLRTGDMHHLTAFTSTTFDPEISWDNVKTFAWIPGQDNDEYTIWTLNNCPHGRLINHRSLFPTEAEVLLPPHLYFRVVGIVRRTTPPCMCGTEGMLCATCGRPRAPVVIEVTLSFEPFGASYPKSGAAGVLPSDPVTPQEIPFSPQRLPEPPKPPGPVLLLRSYPIPQGDLRLQHLHLNPFLQVPSQKLYQPRQYISKNMLRLTENKSN